ncbi:MAG: DUF3108 domain-containing protein [Elusimicrobia bacterium]|nr:DUF3108 domain-containing protein [Elusimicrobiota bacterium]
MSRAWLLSWGLLLACGPAVGADIFTASFTDPRELVGLGVEPSTDVVSVPGFPQTLVFDVSWGVIGVGQSTLEMSRLVDFNGRPAYEIVSRAVSNGFCDTFFKVRDVNYSWLDARTLSSLGYLKNLREGHFYRDEWTLFDHAAKRYLAKWAGRDHHYSVRQGTIPVPVQDILSSMVFIRTQELKEGAEIILDVNTKENWPLVVKVVKRTKVKVPAGRFDTFLLEPALRKEGIFIQKGKRLRVWVTADERRIPVLMKVEVFFGHITAALHTLN